MRHNIKLPRLATLTASIFLALGMLGSLKADTDIDYDDGVVTVTTDHHDDFILIRQEGSRLAIRIFQMDPDFFDHAEWINEFFLEPDAEGWSVLNWENEDKLDWLDDMAENTRVWRRGFDNVLEVRINSLGGNDGIIALNIPQRLIFRGGDESDCLQGGIGQNYLFGDDGDDWIRSGISTSSYSVSYMFGGEGDDSIRGGSGDDTVWGGNGEDHISTYWGDDTVYAGGDDDTVRLGGGDDAAYGQSGRDSLYGDSGNDYLNGGYDGERDYLVGGSGFDEGVTLYYRYTSRYSRNKDLMIRLEEEGSYQLEIKSGEQR